MEYLLGENRRELLARIMDYWETDEERVRAITRYAIRHGHRKAEEVLSHYSYLFPWRASGHNGEVHCHLVGKWVDSISIYFHGSHSKQITFLEEYITDLDLTPLHLLDCDQYLNLISNCPDLLQDPCSRGGYYGFDSNYYYLRYEGQELPSKNWHRVEHTNIWYCSCHPLRLPGELTPCPPYQEREVVSKKKSARK